MFTWICPKCGQEVPPSETDCPTCRRASAAAESAPAVAEVPPPPPPPTVQTPVQAPPPLPQMAVATSAAPPAAAPAYLPAAAPGHGMPTWLLAILFAVVFAGVGAGVYWFVGSSHDTSRAAVQAPMENAGTKSEAGAANPLQKFIEVSGVRWVPLGKDKKQVGARFLVVNHSEADVAGLSGTVTVQAKEAKGSELEGSFTFTTNLAPLEGKELTVPMETTRKIYELPDWQFVVTDLRITAPR